MGLYARVFLLRLHLRGCTFWSARAGRIQTPRLFPHGLRELVVHFPARRLSLKMPRFVSVLFWVRRNSWPGRLKFVVLATRKCPPQMKLNVSLLAVYFRNTYRASCALRSSSNSLAWTATPCTRTLGCGTGHWPWLREARTRATPSTPSGRPHPGKRARLNARHQKPWAWCQYSTG